MVINEVRGRIFGIRFEACGISITNSIIMKTEKIIHRGLNEKITTYEHSLCNRTGILISLGLIGFFVAMIIVGLSEVLWLRYLNFAILLVGIIAAFKIFSKKLGNGGIHYFDGLRMGARITLTAMIPFALFIGIYLKIDTGFMNYVKQSAEFGDYLTPASAAAGVAFEGIVSGFLTSYCLMQYFKSRSETDDD